VIDIIYFKVRKIIKKKILDVYYSESIIINHGGNKRRR